MTITVTIQITRFIDIAQPGFVECRLIDAEGQAHTFIEKVPIVSQENLHACSAYPRPGKIACIIEKQWEDNSGRKLAQISTEQPDHVESTIGKTCFMVLHALLNE